jgi:hypothetical protein
MFFESFQDGGQGPQENTCIPKEFAAFQKYLGQLQVGLFCKCFYLMKVIRFIFDSLAFNLYVTVAGFRAAGSNAKSQ